MSASCITTAYAGGETRTHTKRGLKSLASCQLGYTSYSAVETGVEPARLSPDAFQERFSPWSTLPTLF